MYVYCILFYIPSYNIMETQKRCYILIYTCVNVMLYYREPGIFYKTYHVRWI